MSDNVTKLKTGSGRRRFLLRAALVLLVLVLVMAALLPFLYWDRLNLDRYLRRFRYEEAAEDVFFDAHSSNRYALCGRGLAVASVSGLELFGQDFLRQEEISAVMASPALSAAGEYALCFDIGGTALMLAEQKKGQVFSLTASGPIYDADTSADGAVALSAAESGYKSVLRVYDSRHREAFRWFSSSRFMPLCAVSPKGSVLAAVSLGQEDGSFVSDLHLFRTNDSENALTVSLGSQMISDLRFLDAKTLCVLGEDELLFFSPDGEKLGACEMEGYLRSYAYGGEDFVLLYRNLFSAGTQGRVTAVAADGSELGNVEVREEVLDIAAAGDYFAVLTREQLTVFRSDFTVYDTVPNDWSASDVLLRSDGSVILLSGSIASLYLPE